MRNNIPWSGTEPVATALKDNQMHLNGYMKRRQTVSATLKISQH